MGKTYRMRDSDRSSRSRLSQMKEALEWLEIRSSRIHGRGVFARRESIIAACIAKNRASDVQFPIYRLNSQWQHYSGRVALQKRRPVSIFSRNRQSKREFFIQLTH